MSSPDSAPSTHSTASFTEVLPGLKQRGCSVIVVGAVPDEAHEHACERLLGDATAESRRRLLVRTGAEEGVGAQVATDSDSSTRVIGHDLGTRASAVGVDGSSEITPNGQEPSGPVASSTPPEAGEATRFEGGVEDGISELGDRISTAIAEIEASAGTLSPAELRVCLDSVFALVDAHGHAVVARLLRPVLGAVREVRGMVHCHLPVARDTVTVDALGPLFDAVIELRVELGRLQQRWHLREGPSSEWLPLASPMADTRGGSR